MTTESRGRKGKAGARESGQWRVDSLGEVARFWGVNVQTVKRWRAEGLPGEARKWDLAAIARWRLEWLGSRRGKAQGERDADGVPIEPSERERYWKAKSAQLEYESKAGKRIHISEHEKAINARSGWFHRVISLLASQLAPLVANKTARQCRSIIDEHARSVLKTGFGEQEES